MLRDRISRYYLEEDHNCAESLLLACDVEYDLRLYLSDIKAVSGFGKGLGVERTCGTMLVGLSVLGRLFVEQQAHATEGFGDMCARFVKEFEEKLGSDQCHELRARYLTDEKRCLETVLRAADVLEEFIRAERAKRNTPKSE